MLVASAVKYYRMLRTSTSESVNVPGDVRRRRPVTGRSNEQVTSQVALEIPCIQPNRKTEAPPPCAKSLKAANKCPPPGPPHASVKSRTAPSENPPVSPTAGHSVWSLFEGTWQLLCEMATGSVFCRKLRCGQYGNTRVKGQQRRRMEIMTLARTRTTVTL